MMARPHSASPTHVRLRALAALLAAATATAAQQRPDKAADKQGDKQAEATLGDLVAFRQWLQDYGKGTVRLVKGDKTDDAAVAAVDALMLKVERANTLPAAQLLFEAAAIDPEPPGAGTTERIDFQRELQPWRIHRMARTHLCAMTTPEIVPWLARLLTAKGIRQKQANDDQRHAATALRILGDHPSPAARDELLRACRTLPGELRVQATAAVAANPRKEHVPTLVELLRDTEPNVRIAAAGALGQAMQPLVDETLGMQPTGELLALRDDAIAKLELLLVRDAVWQVRSAAAFALASMKCKAVIPALIHGLDAELGRTKDPWAMDLRLHKILEGLTGQSVARGSVAPWKEFWQKEGPSFTVRKQSEADGPKVAADRYHRFFDLEIESDRVLFVLDFSGSMAEPIALRATGGGGTGVGGQGQAAQTTTKAALVVQEITKLVTSLPDGALVNFVVFGDEVRVWRQEGGRPALVRLDDDARDDLLGHFLPGLRPSGATNLYGALQAAIDFGGRGLYDKYYAAGFDTLYVISDGAPTAGAITDKDEIRRRVRESNQLRRFTINCITFGDKNDTDFMRPMAEENGGRHIHIE